jgi:hypothetical protein
MIMIMIMIMIVVVVVVVVMVMSAVTVMMLMAGHVFAVVPIITDKVYRAAAGMIFSAVPCPMTLMAWRYMDIHRRTREGRIAVNHNGTRIDQRRGLWHIAEIDFTKKSRLADIHGHPDIRCHYRCGGNKQPS